MTDISVPNNVPKKYRAKLISFIQSTGGRFGCMYYKPLRARIVDPEKFTTTYVVNLENGEICVPRKGKRQTLGGNATLDNVSGELESDSIEKKGHDNDIKPSA